MYLKSVSKNWLLKLFHLYSKKCTVTCGKCKGDCEDTHPLPYCLKWKEEGRCTNSLQWWMKKRCKRTCGYCNNDNASSTTTTTTTTTAPPPNCKVEYIKFQKFVRIESAGGCCYAVFHGEFRNGFDFAVSCNFEPCWPFQFYIVKLLNREPPKWTFLDDFV